MRSRPLGWRSAIKRSASSVTTTRPRRCGKRWLAEDQSTSAPSVVSNFTRNQGNQMKTTERNEAALPTGFLADQRASSAGQDAGSMSPRRSMPTSPPSVRWSGTIASFRRAGIGPAQARDAPGRTLWPQQMQPYCGADLQSDLRTRAGFRHSRYWLSKQLCVPERIVTDVIRTTLTGPHCWLLKLAELSATYPPR